MKRLATRAGLALIALLLIVMITASLLLFSEQGLRFVFEVSRSLLPGELSAESIDGKLSGPFSLTGLEYRNSGGVYRVGQLDVDWRPSRLWRGQLYLAHCDMQNVSVKLTPGPTKPAQPVSILLPVRIELTQFHLDRAEITLANGRSIPITSLDIAANAAGRSVEFRQLDLHAPRFKLQAKGQLGLSYTTNSRLAGQWQSALVNNSDYRGKFQISGTYQSLELTQELQQPIAAKISATLTDLTTTPGWSLHGEIPGTSMRHFAPEWPDTQVGATLAAQGNLQNAAFRAQLDSSLPQFAGQPLMINGKLVFSPPEKLSLPEMLIRMGDSRIEIQGSWWWQEQRGDLLARWNTLQWPLTGTPQLLSPHGSLAWAGRPDEYRIKADGGFQSTGQPLIPIELSAVGDRKSLTITQANATLWDGRVTTTGVLNWQQHLQWNVELQGHDLNPATQWPDWPGALGFQAHASGGLFPQGARLDARLDKLQGELRRHPISGQGRLQLQGKRWSVQDLRFQSQNNTISISGSPSATQGLAWQIQLADMETLIPTATGNLSGSGHVVGDWPDSRIEADLHSQNLSLHQLRLATLDGTIRASLSDGSAPLTVQLTGKNGQWKNQPFEFFTMEATGSTAQQTFSLALSGRDVQLDLHAQGGWQSRRWQGLITEADWRLPQTGAWALESSSPLKLNDDGVELGNACWRQADARLCLQGMAHNHYRSWTAQGRVQALPMTRLLTNWTSMEVTTSAVLSADFQAEMDQNRLHSQGNIHVSPGEIGWHDVAETAALAHGRGNLTWQLNDEGLRADAHIALQEQDSLTAGLFLPAFQPMRAVPANQTVQGQLTAEIEHLNVLELFLTELRNVQGKLSMNARLGGTLAQPELTANARLARAGAQLPLAGITLTDMEMRADTPANGRIDFKGRAHSGNGKVDLAGQLEFASSQPWKLQLTVRGDDFLVLNNPEAWLPVSPNITLTVTPPRLDLKGDILIKEARLAPSQFTTAIRPAPDLVIIAGGKAPPPSPWQISSQIGLTLGQRVKFTGYGLEGTVTGHLDIQDIPGQTTRARGDLKVITGTYSAYGQTLTIENGRLLYSGGPIDNPAVDASAVRVVGDVTAGLRLNGLLQHPEIELFSRPQMSQTDMLSYLILGRPLATASSAQGQLLYNAATALGIKGGYLLAAQIGQSLGLDEVGLEGGSEPTDTSLVIGKYLSPRLYVNYSVGLFDTINQLRLRYTLSRRWTLETVTGAAMGGDLIYSIER